MIVERERLMEIVEADSYGSLFVPLHVATFREFKGHLEINGGGYNYEVTTEPRFYNGTWMLSPGVYHLHFEERIRDADADVMGFIFPSGNSLMVGAEAAQRPVYTDTELWTLFNVNKSIEIEEGSILAVLIMLESQDIPEIEDLVQEEVAALIEKKERDDAINQSTTSEEQDSE